jgi:hypothetical protein
MDLNFDKREYLNQLYHSRFMDRREGVYTYISIFGKWVLIAMMELKS